MIMEAVLALKLIELTAPDGALVHINPSKVLSVHTPRKGKDSLFSPNVHCVISAEDRRFISVINSCAEVRKLLGEAE